MNHEEKIECPHCKVECEVDFSFYRPEDGDCEYEDFECEACGCEFEVSCTVEVEVDFHLSEATVTKLPEKPAEPEEIYVSKDPNQISLL